MSGRIFNRISGYLKGIAKGATAAAQATVTTVDADHNALDVSVRGTPALAADAATATLQGTGNASLASILLKIIAAPATEAKQDTGNASLVSILAKFTDGLARFGVLGADGSTIASFTNALAVFGGLLSNHSSATIPATGVQIKGSPGSAYSVNYKNDTGFTRYLQIHNTVGQPGAGARSVWSSAALATGTAATLQMGHTLSGACCSTAVYFVISSSIYSYTAAADTAIQVELLYK